MILKVLIIFDPKLNLFKSDAYIFMQQSLVQLKTASGRMPQFGDEQFKDQTENEMLADLVKPIIKAVWLNKDSNDVIGILSKNEIDIVGDISKRLIFFVKKNLQI